MPEVPIWVVGLAMLFTVVMGSFLGKAIMLMDGRREPIEGNEELPPPEVRDLNRPQLQAMLQTLIDRYHLHGSCQIVDGRVMRREIAGEREPYAKALRLAVENTISMVGGNANLGLYTMFHGKPVPIGSLGLDDLLGFIAMLETAHVDGMRDGVAAAKHAQRLSGGEG